MPGMIFVVGEKDAFCVWDPDFRERNLTFIESVDADYFMYLAAVHGEQIAEEPQHAAFALRTAYHHGLETFFSLLFAAVQAPRVAYAWVLKYRAGAPALAGRFPVRG